MFQQTLEYIMEFDFPKKLAYSLDLIAFNEEIHRFNQGNCYIQWELEMQLSARMGYFGKERGKRHALNLDENVCYFFYNEISNIICTAYPISIFKGNCPTHPHYTMMNILQKNITNQHHLKKNNMSVAIETLVCTSLRWACYTSNGISFASIASLLETCAHGHRYSDDPSSE